LPRRRRRTIVLSMLHLAIVEDDPAHLAQLGRVLAHEPDFEVVGLYPSAEAALAGNDWTKVDVLLTDLELPGISGVGLIARVVQENPRVLLLAYTVHDQRDTVFAALRAGAFGYVVKGGTAEDLVEAIRRAVRGESPLSPPVARYLIDAFLSGFAQSESGRSEDLTPRESELLRLVASGLIYKEIGERLGISHHTVHAHVRNIYEKLHAVDRPQALRRARVLGYLDSDQGSDEIG